MLLDKRPCLIVGTKSGDLSLTNVLLDRFELNALLEDPGAWECWFKERRGALPSPAEWTRHLRRFVHTEKFECPQAVFFTKEYFAVSALKIRKLTLTPQTGGLTELSLLCRAREVFVPHPRRAELAEVRLDIAAVPITAPARELAHETVPYPALGARLVSWLTPAQPSL